MTSIAKTAKTIVLDGFDGVQHREVKAIHVMGDRDKTRNLYVDDVHVATIKRQGSSPTVRYHYLHEGFNGAYLIAPSAGVTFEQAIRDIAMAAWSYYAKTLEA